MPLGMTHDETGRLNERDGRYTLRRDGGGEWRLDLGLFAALKVRRLAGRRVRVRGVRDGFDLLAVHRVDALRD